MEVAAALGGAEPPRSRGPRDACRALVEQFVVDVGSVTTAQRAAALSVLGGDAFAFMQVVYVCDMDTRLRAAGRQLYGAEPGAPRPVEATDLWSALEDFMQTVARMQALDPLTSELVRLRGARAHRCRLCQSVRSVRAAEVGADESVYDQIDAFEVSALSDRHKTALRLVDAMLWQPSSYPDGLADEVNERFTPPEAAEIVLDVVRNAANKIAVAFAADEPHVSEGIKLYDIDARGEVVYGVGRA